MARDSALITGPPARLMARATPPPCFNDSLAGLTMASRVMEVMSARSSSSVFDPICSSRILWPLAPLVAARDNETARRGRIPRMKLVQMPRDLLTVEVDDLAGLGVDPE